MFYITKEVASKEGDLILWRLWPYISLEIVEWIGDWR